MVDLAVNGCGLRTRGRLRRSRFRLTDPYRSRSQRSREAADVTMTKPKDHLELTLLFQLRALGLPEPEREYRFHPERKWRFDFAYPDPIMVAAEVEGGTWSSGRHVRGAGFEKDCIKYSEAAILGWTVIRVTSNMVEDGRAISLIERSLKIKQDQLDKNK